MKKLHVAMVVGVLGTGGSARAELWTPLDSIPTPNAIVGVSHGVTAGMEYSCSGHHPTRLSQVKGELTTTLDTFERYFIFGGFTYNGCGAANVSWRQMPDPVNPNNSYTSLVNRINTLGHCGSGEKYWPGTGTNSCLMPDAYCFADAPVLSNIASAQGLVGMTLPSPTLLGLAGPFACTLPGAPEPSMDLEAAIAARFSVLSWPRLSTGNAPPPPGQILTDLCGTVETALNQIKSELDLCVPTPANYWDMSFLTGTSTTWCDHNAMAAPGTGICDVPTTASPPGLRDSCVCASENPLCAFGPPKSDCGIIGTTDPYPWGAPAMQQQVAVCEAYNPNPGHFGAYFQSQPDNRVNGNCRENVAMFVTDGLHGQVFPVGLEANAAFATGGIPYRSVSGLSNMFVFNTAAVTYTWQAHAMENHVSQGAHATAYDANNLNAFQESFATVLSRVYKGVYSGSTMGQDQVGTRIAIHSMTVPGFSTTAPITDTYHDFPAKVSVYQLNADGSRSTVPLYETDWASKNTIGPGALNTAECGAPTWIGVPGGGADRNIFGPDGNFRVNGLPRTVSVASGQIDRDGIRDPVTKAWVINPDDTLPAGASGGVIVGKSGGFAATAPIFVGRPQDAPGNGFDTQYGAFLTAAVQQRPQGLYFADGGYVLGVHAGRYRSPAPDFGFQKRAYDYDDSVNDAGREILRYMPWWVKESNLSRVKYRWDINDIVPQPMMVGELVSRDLYIRDPNTGTQRFRTLLIGNQGWSGPGYFVLDITDPCNVAQISAWQLPMGSYASGAPTVAYWKRNDVGRPNLRPVVITTSGLDATNNALYVYDLAPTVAPPGPAAGTLLGSIALPAGGAGVSYPSAPTCVDVTGRGAVTHCYVLRSDGRVYRARIDVSGAGNAFFAAVNDVTPLDSGGVARSVGGGKVYSAAPTAYFDAKGRVNLVFGSGDHRNLTGATPANHVYRAVDLTSHQAGVPNAPMRLDSLCTPSAGNTHGDIALGANQRLLSAPVVANNLVAFAAYEVVSSGCSSGTGKLYVMNAETCAEANTANGIAPRPASVDLGSGIPTSPVYHRQSGTFLVGGSAKPTSTLANAASTTNSRSTRYLHRKLYFRVGSL